MINKITELVGKWWLVLILGILSVLMGIIVAGNPAFGFETITALMIAELIMSGVIAAAFIIINRSLIIGWGWNLIGPVCLVILGIIISCTDGASETLLLIFYSSGIIVSGIQAIVCAVFMNKVHAKGWVWTLILGIITVILGCMLAADPLAGIIAIGLMVAFTMISFGIEMITMSIVMSKAHSLLKRTADNE